MQHEENEMKVFMFSADFFLSLPRLLLEDDICADKKKNTAYYYFVWVRFVHLSCCLQSLWDVFLLQTSVEEKRLWFTMK